MFVSEYILGIITTLAVEFVVLMVVGIIQSIMKSRKDQIAAEHLGDILVKMRKKEEERESDNSK